MRTCRTVGRWLGRALAALAGLALLAHAALAWWPLPPPDIQPLIPPLVRLLAAVQQGLYRLSAGRLGGTFARAPVLLLTTTGRRSGRRRTTPLIYLAEGETLVVAGSNGGAARPPGWWLNLRRCPRATVQLGRSRRRVGARRATAAERARLWPRLVALYPDYATYQRRLSREIPVVLLEPERGAAAPA